MEVGDGFAGVGTVIDDEAKPMGEVEFLRDGAGDEEEVTEDRLVRRRGFADARYHLFGHNQKVHGRLRLNVVKHHAVLVLVFDAGGNFAGDDFFEERFHGAAEEQARGQKNAVEPLIFTDGD